MVSEALFLVLVAIASVVAGAIASVAGFGIGSLLTPLLGMRVGTKLAVAAVSVPHLFATGLRLWIMRKHVDRRLLWSFGLMSAVGGLTGALLHSFANNPALTILFGGLLIFAGVMGLSGFDKRLKFKGWTAWVAGFVSGALGGLVGNQGGIRSAAMLGFDVPRQAFIATATAVGLIVDAARMPVYVFTQWKEVAALWPILLVATGGCLAGTLVGDRILKRVPEPLFRKVVAGLLLALGVLTLIRVGYQSATPAFAAGIVHLLASFAAIIVGFTARAAI